MISEEEKLAEFGPQACSLPDIVAIVDDIIAREPNKVAQIKEHPFKVGWLVGKVMQAAHGKGNPKEIHEVIADKLGWNDNV